MTYARSAIVENSGRSLLRDTAGQTVMTLAATLLVQGSTFAILSLAGLWLPLHAFARLSVVVATVMMSSALCELGVSITATRIFKRTGDERALRLGFAVRLVTLLVVSAIAGLVGVFGWLDLATGLFLGAALNIWTGLRATDQAREDYRSFIRSSALFALLRSLAGIGALLLNADPLIIAAALYFFPLLASWGSKSAILLRQAFRDSRTDLPHAARYALQVYINSVAFIAAPYVPQYFAASRLDVVAVGTYSLVLTFAAPLSLVVYALRSVLLPKMIGSDSSIERLLWSRRGAMIIFGCWVMVMVGGLILGACLDWIYAARFPDLASAFIFYFAAITITAAVGICSLSVHTVGAPGLASLISLAKLIVIVGVCLLWGHSLFALIGIVGVAMAVFEVLLICLLARRRLA